MNIQTIPYHSYEKGLPQEGNFILGQTRADNIFVYQAFDLVMKAKLTDFDTWCGFDGEMVFYTLGYQNTKDYLKNNVEKFSQETVDYFLGFDEAYLYNDINSRAFWYF